VSGVASIKNEGWQKNSATKHLCHWNCCQIILIKGGNGEDDKNHQKYPKEYIGKKKQCH
jgi:hypothetical protein